MEETAKVLPTFCRDSKPTLPPKVPPFLLYSPHSSFLSTFYFSTFHFLKKKKKKKEKRKKKKRKEKKRKEKHLG